MERAPISSSSRIHISHTRMINQFVVLVRIVDSETLPYDVQRYRLNIIGH